jgi:hypothetical protein
MTVITAAELRVDAECSQADTESDMESAPPQTFEEGEPDDLSGGGAEMTIAEEIRHEDPYGQYPARVRNALRAADVALSAAEGESMSAAMRKIGRAHDSGIARKTHASEQPA